MKTVIKTGQYRVMSGCMILKKEEKMKKGKFGRIPLPRTTGGPHSSKKGKKGYNRRSKHKEETDDKG